MGGSSRAMVGSGCTRDPYKGVTTPAFPVAFLQLCMTGPLHTNDCNKTGTFCRHRLRTHTLLVEHDSDCGNIQGNYYERPDGRSKSVNGETVALLHRCIVASVCFRVVPEAHRPEQGRGLVAKRHCSVKTHVGFRGGREL